MLVLIVLIRVPLLSLFSDDPEVIRLGAQLLVLGIVLETGRTLNIVVINSLRAAGDAKYPLWIGIFSMVCMSLPLGYFLVFVLDMGVAGVWLAIAADEWTRAVIMMHRWKSRRWERYSLVQQTGREAIPAESL
ncbi:MATE family multidrug exporter [compost metagenome]